MILDPVTALDLAHITHRAHIRTATLHRLAAASNDRQRSRRKAFRSPMRDRHH